MNSQRLRAFRKTVLDHHARHGRHSLPWRQTRDPYRIMVSEIMLQQTQVARVLSKYDEFLRAFPTAEALAQSSTAPLLAVWKGLGYNRRALNLKRAAEAIVRDHGGSFPRDAKALEALPGIGQSTRGAIMAFAFGIPTAFIETNIRAVYIHHFFKEAEGKTAVHDRDLIPLIEESVLADDPRTWYYALMDYGVHLKATMPNPSRRSAHHVRQSPFKGSNRELRSQMLQLILEAPRKREAVIRHFATAGKDPAQIERNLRELEKEGFVSTKRNIISIA